MADFFDKLIGIDTKAEAKSKTSKKKTSVGGIICVIFGVLCIMASLGGAPNTASQDDAVIISGGSPEMAGVTGTGCMSSVIMAAFISGARLEDKNVKKISDFEACVSAVKYIDAAAERAEENLKYLRAKEALPFGNYGTGSYRVLFMDQLSVNRI